MMMFLVIGVMVGAVLLGIGLIAMLWHGSDDLDDE
jgi:hypothetical protein